LVLGVMGFSVFFEVLAISIYSLCIPSVLDVDGEDFLPQ